jgi:hypothetical protein
MRLAIAACVVALGALGLSAGPSAADTVKALGAVACGQSTCHSATKPWPNSSVTQREFVIWHEKDPHARAYQTLQSPRAQAIARDLGFRSATSAKLCLDCHTLNVPPARTEPTFNVAEGVTCEACHGLASEWLGVHQTGLYFYQRNIDEGMYPTTDPTARAELCLSCHMGTREKFVNHRMFVAGHPRLPFELGFYTWFSEPRPGQVAGYAHFEVDDDYLQRKPWPFGIKVWSIGQAVQMRKLMQLMTDPNIGQAGLFPEFAFFDCHSCHNASLSGRQADSQTGVPRINDAHAFFVELSASLVDRGLAARLRDDIARVRGAAGRSWDEMRSAAGQLERDLGTLIARLEAREFEASDTRRALSAIADASQRGVFDDYYEAEQAVLAAGSLVDELDKLEVMDPGRAVAAQAAIRSGLAAFVSIDDYRPGQVTASLGEAARLAR